MLIYPPLPIPFSAFPALLSCFLQYAAYTFALNNLHAASLQPQAPSPACHLGTLVQQSAIPSNMNGEQLGCPFPSPMYPEPDPPTDPTSTHTRSNSRATHEPTHIQSPPVPVDDSLHCLCDATPHPSIMGATSCTIQYLGPTSVSVPYHVVVGCWGCGHVTGMWGLLWALLGCMYH